MVANCIQVYHIDTMTVQITITPNDSLTQAELEELCERAAEKGRTPAEWAAAVLRAALIEEPKAA